MSTAALRERPIPPVGPAIQKKTGYREWVQIAEAAHSDDLVDVRELGIAGVNHYATPHNPPYFQIVPGAVEALFLRRSVADRLLQVNAKLREDGLELYLFDAWRPQAIQRHFHDVWFPQYLRARHPDWSDAQIAQEVDQYWAAPSAGETSPSPHSTGGAVDLTLCVSATGQALFMGGIFDDLTENAHTDRFEGDASTMSDEDARANRRILFWSMIEAGFANNPTEWWHYSFGDQLWARLTDQDAALFGACEPPTI